LYIFGIVFAQGVIDHFADHDTMYTEGRHCYYASCNALLRHYFGSLPRSIFTCFKAILGGIDWEVAVMALSDVGQFYVFMFVALIVFVYLAVMNVISGLFLQSAIEQAQQDVENVIVQQQHEKDTYAKRFERLFEEIDHDHDSCINLHEFEDALGKVTMQHLLQAMEVEASDAWTLFKLLDADGGGNVDRREFIDGCLQLKGPAKSIHIAQQRYEIKWVMDSLLELAHFCEASFQDIRKMLGQFDDVRTSQADEPPEMMVRVLTQSSSTPQSMVPVSQSDMALRPPSPKDLGRQSVRDPSAGLSVSPPPWEGGPSSPLGGMVPQSPSGGLLMRPQSPQDSGRQSILGPSAGLSIEPPPWESQGSLPSSLDRASWVAPVQIPETPSRLGLLRPRGSTVSASQIAPQMASQRGSTASTASTGSRQVASTSESSAEQAEFEALRQREAQVFPPNFHPG